MKFIKGAYKRELKKHEDIKYLVRNERQNKFYYLQENEDFSYNLMIYDDTLDIDDFNDTIDYKDKQYTLICNLSNIEKYSINDLKKIIKKKGLI